MKIINILATVGLHLLLFTCWTVKITATEVSYAGYEVLRATPLSLNDVSLLKTMAMENEVDIWTESVNKLMPVDLMVSADVKAKIQTTLRNKRIPFTTYISDVQSLIDKQKRGDKEDGSQKAPRNTLTSVSNFAYDEYHDYDEICEWIDAVVSEYPELATKKQFGTTYEGRPMYVLIFTKGTASPAKPVIFVDAITHAREWITTGSLLYIFKEMLTNPDYAHMMEDADWYFVPVINIDGYVHTWTTDRLWRKTKYSGTSSRCIGIDGNRNWDSYWSGAGSSPDPCSIFFLGATPASEPSIRHLANYILSVGKVDAYISTHSYSQLILYPYNHANIATKDDELLSSVARRMKDAMRAVHGTNYTPGIGAIALYPFAGSTSDWTYDVAAVPLSYTFELRDEGDFGFVLPPEQIIPTGEEYLAGLEVLKNQVLLNG